MIIFSDRGRGAYKSGPTSVTTPIEAICFKTRPFSKCKLIYILIRLWQHTQHCRVSSCLFRKLSKCLGRSSVTGHVFKELDINGEVKGCNQSGLRKYSKVRSESETTYIGLKLTSAHPILRTASIGVSKARYNDRAVISSSFRIFKFPSFKLAAWAIVFSIRYVTLPGRGAVLNAIVY